MLIGGCECGAVSYQINSNVIPVYVCHCLNCQTRSGSAFAQHSMITEASFTCSGETCLYERTEHGIVFAEHFCRVCSTRLYNRNSYLTDMIFVRAGTFLNSQCIEPMMHIWTSRKQDWVTLPDDVPFTVESPTPDEFAAALQFVKDKRENMR